MLRYYIWGGKESYLVRQQIREKVSAEEGDNSSLELPEWKRLVAFVGIVISAPQDIFQCAYVCRELSMHFGVGRMEKYDQRLKQTLRSNSRLRQYSLALAEYLVLASGIPKDLYKNIEKVLLEA
jgi:hypothetical protein